MNDGLIVNAMLRLCKNICKYMQLHVFSRELMHMMKLMTHTN